MANVFLAIPMYNQSVDHRTVLGVMFATQNHNVRVGMRSSSLLAHGFNHLWCDAIASGCDYFAMCHADIGPDPGWVDTLIDRLHEYDADLMSACIPIKADYDEYSVAMGIPGECSTYRLPGAHLRQVPETFGTEDVRDVAGEGGWLLANTGLWVCRLGETWNRQVSFSIKSWIDWDSEPPQPMVIPEDWDFSHQLHRLGLSVMCTKAVGVVHVGQHAWKRTADVEVLA